MGFKNDFIYTNLTHDPRHQFKEIIDNNVLFNLIWYFVSNECYAQRNSTLDEYMGAVTPADYFFRIWIYRILELNEFKIFTGNMVTLDNQVDTINMSDLERNLLYLHISNKSVFNSIFEKLRNSIAHGTFNLTSHNLFMLGQKSSKKESAINFYYQTADKTLKKIEKIINILISDTTKQTLCHNALIEQPQVYKDGNSLKYKEKEIRVEYDFCFCDVKSHGSQLEQIKKYVEEKDYKDSLLILCCPTNAIFSDDDLSKRNVGIIPYTHLHTFFDCNITMIS